MWLLITSFSVTEPPSTPQIMDAEGNEVMGVAGPYMEGYDMHMSCHVSGGEFPKTNQVKYYRKTYSAYIKL